ncbi:MAG TPA: hypothetical protein VFZ41_08815 [Solirubrobacterales bacterium]
MDTQTLSLITIPLFTGAIGYVTNMTGVWMLFYPIRFHGIRAPGLAALATLLPRRVQQIPGVMQGGIGWQGIVPSRAAKMGSIAVDKGIAKLGGAGDFYRQLDPEAIAEQILTTARDEIEEVVERIMERGHPQLWHDLPERLREVVHARVQEQLPEIVRSITDQIGEHIDELLNVKLMVIRHLEENPQLTNRIFLEVGSKELRFIVNFGFFFGFMLGVPTAFVTELVLTQWWVLPIAGVLIGYSTNLLGIRMIFEPVRPRRLGPLTIQGLFIKRQPEVAGVYADVIASDIVTMSNIAEDLLHGPNSDRTRQMIEVVLRPAVDMAAGRARPAVRVAVGPEQYAAIRSSVAEEAAGRTVASLTDSDFDRMQSNNIREFVTQRVREMGPADFSEMLRTVVREDEWLLYLHGAVLGFGAGLLHLAIFG